MYQMNCTNCGEHIKSPLLSEVHVIDCPQCKEIVVVKNVAVLQEKKPTIIKYNLKKILHSAFQFKKYNNFDLKTKYVIGERLSKQLIRDDYRLNLSSDLYGQLDFDKNKRLARLLNISYEGAGVEFTERGQLPKNNTETTFQLLLPGYAEALSLPAKIVWIRTPAKGTISPKITMGLQFKDIDQNTHKCLCGFIWGSS